MDVVPRRVRVRDAHRPVDYADPGGRTIDLAVLKVPADDPADRVGSLVVNPGGPGAPGTSYAAAAPPSPSATRSASDFDIVGFDPRGTGASRPGRLPLRRRARRATSPPTPTRTRRRGGPAARQQGSTSFGRGLRRRTPAALAAHVSHGRGRPRHGRAARGARRGQLDYFGASYGTKLGATYAELFPEQVGRFVLDGAVDLSIDSAAAEPRAGGAASRPRCGPTSQNCVETATASSATPSTTGSAPIQRLHRRASTRSRCRPAGDRRADRRQRLLRHRRPALQPRVLVDPRPGAASRRSTATARCCCSSPTLYASRGPDGSYTDNSAEAISRSTASTTRTRSPPTRCPAEHPGVPGGLADVRRRLRLGPDRLPRRPGREATEEPTPDDRRGRRGADRGRRHHPRPGDAVRSGRCALADQLESACWSPATATATPATTSGNDCVDEAVEDYLVDGTVPDDGLEC